MVGLFIYPYPTSTASIPTGCAVTKSVVLPVFRSYVGKCSKGYRKYIISKTFLREVLSFLVPSPLNTTSSPRMHWTSLAGLAFIAPSHALIRFGCSQLVVDRLDPLVQPGDAPSAHLHQIIGGNSFVPDMSPAVHDPPGMSTCTTCQPADDFSNYWTASLYFRARNGTYKRVAQKGNAGFEGQNGGMTVYYMQNQLADYQQQAKVKAFQPVHYFFLYII
jgi:hypothetical protein